MNGRLILLVLLVLSVCAISITISGCSQHVNNTTTNTSLPLDKYIFINHIKYYNGTVIEGSAGYMYIDFPLYSWNEYDKSIKTYSYNISTDNLIAIYGYWESLGGDIGSGASAGASGISDLPYNNGNFTLSKIDVDGTIYVRYEDQNVTLRPGQNWSRITSWIKVDQYLNYTTKMNETSKVNMILTDTIYNYGLWNKSNVTSN
jgi:hypothetical protein